MAFRQLFFRLVGIAVMAILLLGGVYWGVNAYLFTSGPDTNLIAVAASAAFASLFIVGTIFIVVAQGFNTLNNHMQHLSDNADEQLKLLRYIAKQTQPRQ